MADKRPVLNYVTPTRFLPGPPRRQRPLWLRVVIVIEHSVYIAVAAAVLLIVLVSAALIVRTVLGR